MKQHIERFPFAMTAATALVGSCAAVGVIFLVPSAAWRELSGVTIPLLAFMMTTALIMIERQFQERGHERGVATAQVDALTGLPSAPVAEFVLAAEFNAAERGRPLTIVLFSLDEFSRFSARHGDEAGERLMLSVGRVMRRRTRGMNLSVRYGEAGTFLSVLSGTTADGAAIYASRVRKDLTALEVESYSQVVSAGIAAFDPSMQTPRDLVAAATKALAAARSAGGNRVMHDDEIGSATTAR